MARAAAGRWWRAMSVVCVLGGLCLLWPARSSAQADALPDNLEAANAELDAEGVVHAGGGAAITISSMINGATVRVEAENVDYNTRTGEAELYGSVSISVLEYGFSINCDSFHYDPLLRQMDVTGIRVAVPLNAVLERDEVLFESRLSSGKHFYNFRPETIYLAAGRAHFDLSADALGTSDFVIEDVKLTHSAREDTDFYITAHELRLTADERIVLSQIELHVSNLDIGPWPSVSRRLHPKPGLIGYEAPKVGFDRDKGLMLKQPVNLNYKGFKVDSLLDYSGDYGVRARSFGYVEPLPGMKLGLAYGSRSMNDRLRRSYVLTEEYNASLRQRLKLHGPVIDDLWYTLEYGHLIATPEGGQSGAGAAQRAEDTRGAAEGTVKFALIPLGNKLYLATGAQGKFVMYQDSDTQYRSAGGEAGLVLIQGGFEHYVLYQQNFTSGTPEFAIDEVRERELSFATSVSVLPEWRHVIRGVYDIDREEFDKLQIGAMKKQRSYEVGVYWDVARNDAGLEIGLLLD